ncbi:MAG: hypothetical protein CVT59_00395 [Actinobacteria bacterium HGW-Actinobacteria-1]|nr:MAG: hypothetical protein CVT59_00395 [Actinobacteria bacterium HGW-Actinobacteria-1]
MASKPVRTLITIVMDLLVLVAVCATLGIVVRFFGALATTGVGESYLRFAGMLRISAGFEAIATPYGGSFDVNAAITVGVLLLIEWALSIARRRA